MKPVFWIGTVVAMAVAGTGFGTWLAKSGPDEGGVAQAA